MDFHLHLDLHLCRKRGVFRGTCRTKGQKEQDNKKPATTVVAGFSDGTPREIRTPDPLLRRQVLYPAELLAHMLSLENRPTAIIQRFC